MKIKIIKLSENHESTKQISENEVGIRISWVDLVELQNFPLHRANMKQRITHLTDRPFRNESHSVERNIFESDMA
jgi:hypothetical protein